MTTETINLTGSGFEVGVTDVAANVFANTAILSEDGLILLSEDNKVLLMESP